MPPKGESKKEKTMRCLLKKLQTRPICYVNGIVKKQITLDIDYYYL